MSTTAVERAVSTIKSFEMVDDYRIKQAIVGLQNKRKELLGVERLAEEGIKEKLAFLARDLKRVESWRRHKLPMLDEEVLRWRSDSKEGIPLPTFALTSLANPETSFEATGQYYDFGEKFRFDSLTVRPTIPEPFSKHYKDVTEALRAAVVNKKSDITVYTSYTGVIPDSTRALIRNAPFEQENIYLLREVNDWGIKTKKVQRPPRPRRLDPIVVAYEEATLWVIDTFDPTDLEQYVSDEFAVLAGSGLAELMPGSLS